jgi:hypothetical protein
MNLIFENPTAERPYRRYAFLINMLRDNPGSWISVDSDEVTGDNLKKKQATLIQMARYKALKVRTRTENGKLFILAIPTEATDSVTNHPAVRAAEAAARRVLAECHDDIDRIKEEEAEENEVERTGIDNRGYYTTAADRRTQWATEEMCALEPYAAALEVVRSVKAAIAEEVVQ